MLAAFEPTEPVVRPFRYRGYAREIVDRVWAQAEAFDGNDPEVWRKDEYGAWINRLDYGDRHSEYGWEIAGPPEGTLDMGTASLRPMHWENYLDQAAASVQVRITADGLRNSRRLL